MAEDTAVYKSVIPPIGHLAYAALGLAGEAGEVANKVKKVLRDSDGALTADRQEQIYDELGDVLWYLARVASEIGVTLNEVGQHNLNKLAKRKKENTLQGDGDKR